MKTLLTLAWRNIWRNKRRTAITAASVLFALFFALIMRSMQIGTYANYINNIVQAYTGYIQIHKKGYWDDKDINNCMDLTDTLSTKLGKLANVTVVVPRLESFALASFGGQTKGVMVIGIDPDKENKLTHLSKKLVKGTFLNKNSTGILVAQKLANFLEIKVNDTLVLIGQGYHGASAAGKFTVIGILHFPAPELDKQMVYLNLPSAWSFYSAENKITSISLDLQNQEEIKQTVKDINNSLHSDYYEIMKWDEMLVEIVQHIKADNASGLIFLAILYIIVAFGVFGTVLMMTVERIKEFGIMIAVGMKRSKLMMILGLEMLYVGIIGILSGVILSIPLIYYFHLYPIRLGGDMAQISETYGIEPLMCFAFQPGFFINQALIVIGIVVFAVLYPMKKISSLKITEALKTKA